MKISVVPSLEDSAGELTSPASPGSLLLFPQPNKIAVHFRFESPEHLSGLVMAAQLAPCFPDEVANNLLGGPQYLWDCKSIWARGTKRETGNLHPPDERRNVPPGTKTYENDAAAMQTASVGQQMKHHGGRFSISLHFYY